MPPHRQNVQTLRRSSRLEGLQQSRTPFGGEQGEDDGTDRLVGYEAALNHLRAKVDRLCAYVDNIETGKMDLVSSPHLVAGEQRSPGREIVQASSKDLNRHDTRVQSLQSTCGNNPSRIEESMKSTAKRPRPEVCDSESDVVLARRPKVRKSQTIGVDGASNSRSQWESMTDSDSWSEWEKTTEGHTARYLARKRGSLIRRGTGGGPVQRLGQMRDVKRRHWPQSTQSILMRENYVDNENEQNLGGDGSSSDRSSSVQSFHTAFEG